MYSLSYNVVDWLFGSRVKSIATVVGAINIVTCLSTNIPPIICFPIGLSVKDAINTIGSTVEENSLIGENPHEEL